MLTTTSGKTIAVKVDADDGSLIVGDTKIVIYDVYTTNGVIHVIESVIID